MAKLIGVVSKVIGQVFAVGGDGHRRLLVEGDRLFAGEQLETGASGAVAVHLHNGAELTLGRDSSVQLTEDLLANRAPQVQGADPAPTDAQLSDVEQLQRAIAAGSDPTQDAEATAAGGNPTGVGALGGGHSFVLLTEVAGRVDPTIGFPTAGFNLIPELASDDLGALDGNPEGAASRPLDRPVSLQELDVEPSELTLDEANLPHGSVNNPGQLTQVGNFTVVAPDGVFNLSVGGINVVTGGGVTGVGQSMTTGLGNILTITGYDPATGNVSYRYTLTGAEHHPDGAGNNVLGEQFPVLVSDIDGDVASGSLDVRIIDDVPKAVDDHGATPATELQTALSGNVLDNDTQGADRVPGGMVQGATLVGTYGTLVLGADGTYTYTLDTRDADFKDLLGGGTGIEHFTYTLKDADGDTSTATLTIDVNNLDDPVVLGGLDSEGGEVTVFEKHLGDGSAPNAGELTQGGTFSVTAADGLKTLTVGGISLVVDGVPAGFPQSVSTPLGNTLTLTGYNPLTGVVSYTYQLLDNQTHASGDGTNSLSEHFSVTATDMDGSTANGSLDVSIIDDVPKAQCDFAQVTEGNSVSGNVLANDTLGADVRADGQYVVGVRAGDDTSTSAIGHVGEQVLGQYGYLSVDANGIGTYHAYPNQDLPQWATDIFVYTLRDADGDESTATLSIKVLDCNLVAGVDDVTVYEKALDLCQTGDDLAPGNVVGSDPQSPTETATGSLADVVQGGVGALTFALVGSATGQYGQILLQADGSYTYTLTSAPSSPVPANDGPNSVAESFTYQVTDSLGNTTTSTVVISIVDDVPQAHCDYASVTEGGSVGGNVLANDVLGADLRADGQYVVGVRAGSDTSTSAVGHVGDIINGLYGYLTLDAQGNASYHAFPDQDLPQWATDTFVYTLRDADGDESTTTLSVKVLDSQLVAGVDSDVTVYEKALDLYQDGNDLAAGNATGSEPASTAETASGNLAGSVSGATGGLTYSLVGSASGQYGLIEVKADGSYTYTLTSAPKTQGGADDGANTLSDHFAYQASDAQGNSVTGSIVITIVDDVPQVQNTERSISSGQVDSNLLLVIDVSGSMDSPSGVAGLSRLDLAKQAINTLLDQYDALGDIKVQVVTFSSTATDTTPVWVSIDQAKSLIAGLSTGGLTHYDAAATAAQQAFETSGKIAGAQNISYFFSDGEPTSGHGITGTLESDWESFLDDNGITSYAVGLGDGVNTGNLDPLAYDGSSHIDTDSVVVTDLSQLSAVLSDTVQGAPVTGSLMGGGSLGADGGFIKALLVDGTTYTYDPHAQGGQGGYSASGGSDQATFDTSSNSLTITTLLGGTLVVDMDTGEFTYTPPTGNTGNQLEQFGFTASDTDGDTDSATLTVNLYGNMAPLAGADHIITNITGASISLPSAALLANDSDADHDPLSAEPISFNTGFANKGDGFSAGTQIPTIPFSATANKAENQFRDLARSEFTSLSGTMTAALVVAGYLGSISNGNGNGNDEDTFTVTLRKGETLTLDHNRPAGNLMMEWKEAGGSYQSIADGASFTASHDGVYSIHVVNSPNASGNASASENYQLSLVVDYSQFSNEVVHDTYTVSDGHGGTATGNVDISYQAGHTLNGTAGDDVLLAGVGDNTLMGGDGNDVLVAGSGNNSLYGGQGDDLLLAGAGNDLLEGGAGVDTASFANASAGVVVDLGLVGQQDTVGAGLDTFSSIENLIGSDYDDTLIGNAGDNVLNGGVGHDVLNGGAGNDTLLGGAGDDILSGGAGNDTFVWQKGDTGHDTVTDFTPGSDHLDLSQLLQGENATSASLDDYLHFKVSGSGASVVSTIEVSSVAGSAPTQTIELAGVDLAQHYGVIAGAGGVIAAGQDTATIINGMLSDHSLKVDTV